MKRIRFLVIALLLALATFAVWAETKPAPLPPTAPTHPGPLTGDPMPPPRPH